MNYVVKVSDTIHSLTETERPLYIPELLPMAFVAEAHRAEGYFQCFSSTLSNLKCLKFRFGKRRRTVSITTTTDTFEFANKT
jgi:hypothetical protein